jgi:hypothetical protein
MQIETILKKHEDALMDLPNVQAVGIGEKGGRKVIKVFVSVKVSKKSLRREQIIPAVLEGCEVDVDEIGEITPLNSK